MSESNSSNKMNVFKDIRINDKRKKNNTSKKNNSDTTKLNITDTTTDNKFLMEDPKNAVFFSVLEGSSNGNTLATSINSSLSTNEAQTVEEDLVLKPQNNTSVIAPTFNFNNIIKNNQSSVNNVIQVTNDSKDETTKAPVETEVQTVSQSSTKNTAQVETTPRVVVNSSNSNEFLKCVTCEVYASEDLKKYDVVEVFSDTTDNIIKVRKVSSKTTFNFFGVVMDDYCIAGSKCNILTSGVTRARVVSTIKLPNITRSSANRVGVMRDNNGNVLTWQTPVVYAKDDLLVSCNSKHDYIVGKGTVAHEYNNRLPDGSLILYKSLVLNPINGQFAVNHIDKTVNGLRFATVLDPTILDDTILVLL